MDTASVRVVAHLILTQAARVRGQLQQTLEQAATARELALQRYAKSHHIAIEVSLEWARAHCALRPTLTAHLEAEAVVLEAEDLVRVHYGVTSGAAASQGPGAPTHPLLFKVCTAKAQVLSAKNQHQAAMLQAAKVTTGLLSLLLTHDTQDAAAQQAHPPPWIVAQARLEEATCLMDAGMYVKSLQALAAFFSNVNALWDASSPSTSPTALNQPTLPQDEAVKHGGGAAAAAAAEPDMAARAQATRDRATKDVRLHKLGYAHGQDFKWFEDEPQGVARAASGRNQAGAAALSFTTMTEVMFRGVSLCVPFLDCCALCNGNVACRSACRMSHVASCA